MQKDKLEAMFLKNKYPTRAEKATLAATLDITINKVQVRIFNFLILHPSLLRKVTNIK